MEMAFHSAVDYLYNQYNHINNKMDRYQEFIESSELFFDRYENFSTQLRFSEIKIKYDIAKSTFYRLEKKFELAEIWAKKCCELAQEMYLKYDNESYKIIGLYNQHMYWNLRAKRFKAEGNMVDAARCFKKAAFTIYDLDQKVANEDYRDYYYCLSIVNKNDKDIFLLNINKAINLMDSTENINQNYLLGVKYENLFRFNKNHEKRLNYLKKAKIHYYKSNNISKAKSIEYLIYYNLSKRCLVEGNYTNSINYFNKAIDYSKYAYFPNIVPSMDILKNEIFLHKFYLFVSEGDFTKASEMIKIWLSTNKEIKNTLKYKFYEISGFCCELNSKNFYFEEDLLTLENYLDYIRKNKLSITLYNICSLVYSRVSLWNNNIRDEKLFKKINLQIISKITTEDAAKYVERSLKVKSAIEEREWLMQLPSQFSEKFDKSVFLLENSVEGFKYTAFSDFYKLIENFIKIIVDFNSKILWGNGHKALLEEKIAKTNPNKKPFDVFTMGDLVNSIKILKEEKSEYCKLIPDNTFDLLEKHLKIRNTLTHELDVELSKIDILKDISEIIFNLLPSFPTIIKIKDTNKKPWYSAEIQWNQYPKHVNLKYDLKNLNKNYYYSEPKLQVFDNDVSPKLMIHYN